MPKKSAKKNNTVRCPVCNSENVYGMSRVVGYYSIIENWNESKQAEIKDRQKGNYKLTDNMEKISKEQTMHSPQKVKVLVK